MFARSLWSHVYGYVIIRVHGRRLEAMINSAVRDGIHLWRMERASDKLLVARVRAADFARLARHGRRFQVRISVLSKRGVPFWLTWASRRRMFVVGGMLFMAVLYGLAQFVWFVHVDGADLVPAQEILRAAGEAGLRPGTPRDAIRRDEVERHLYVEVPLLAWASVDVRGAVATVRVAERTPLDEALSEPGHVVAVRDGIVERVAVTVGELLVAPGDTVQAGTILISGMPSPGSSAYEERVRAGLPPLLRASGTVWGRTWYRGYGEVRVPEAFSETEGTAADEEWVARAVAEARGQAVENLSPDAQIVDEEIEVVDDVNLVPRVVRAAVTVTVLQNLGRFSPLSAAEPDDGEQLKDESDESQTRTGQHP